MSTESPKKGKRKQISTRRRFEIFKRDGFTCQYCGGHPPSVILHCDHIIPVAEGGSSNDSNLTTACENCNLGKSAVLLSVVPQSLAERAAEVAEREAQLRGYSQIMAAQRKRLDDDAWRVAEIFIEQHRAKGIRKDWFESIRRFIEHIGDHNVIRAMEIATARKPFQESMCFRYFCGICVRVREQGGDV